MKKYYCYIRAVILSILFATIIDAAIHFEDYRRDYLAGAALKQRNVLPAPGTIAPEKTTSFRTFHLIFWR